MKTITNIWGLWSIPLLVAILAVWLAVGSNAVYAADGDLDPTFDGDGIVQTSFNNLHDYVRAMAIQSDGKIVVAGFATFQEGNGGEKDFAVARYLPDGALDPQFSGDGKVTTGFVAGHDDEAKAVVIQPDGKIVVAGSTYDGPFTRETVENIALARYLPNGDLDTGFGNGGTLITDVALNRGDRANAVAIQPDGKIVAAGFALTGHSTGAFVLVRYLADGDLDPTFDDDGKVLTNIGNGTQEVSALAIQSDGKIVAAGIVFPTSGSNSDFGLARYLSSGTLDTDFSGDGKLTTDFAVQADGANAVAIQPDGKIVAAGSATTPINREFGLARYLPNGDLDTSFSGSGTTTTNFGGFQLANGVAIQSDGKIVAAGFVYFSDSGEEDEFALARYLADGTRDSGFGEDGRVTTGFGAGSYDRAYAVAIQGDNKIVLAGQADPDRGPIPSLFTLTRYQSGSSGGPTPTIPPSTATPAASPTPCTWGQFSDVPPGHTFYPYVSCLVNRGVMSGYADCTFRPSLNLTRGQLAKVVSNAANFTEPHTSQSFEDLATDHPFYLWIERLASRGIIGGYACGGENEPCVPPQNRPYFRSGNNVTRGQTSKIVAIAAGLPAPSQGSWTFQDVPGNHTFWQWIEALSAAGAIGGYGCGGEGEPCVPPNNRPYFRVGNNVTRGQASKIVAIAFFPSCQTP